MISTDDKFGLFERFPRDDQPLYVEMNAALQRHDTGVSRLGGEEVAFDNLSIVV